MNGYEKCWRRSLVSFQDKCMSIIIIIESSRRALSFDMDILNFVLKTAIIKYSLPMLFTLTPLIGPSKTVTFYLHVIL